MATRRRSERISSQGRRRWDDLNDLESAEYVMEDVETAKSSESKEIPDKPATTTNAGDDVDGSGELSGKTLENSTWDEPSSPTAPPPIKRKRGRPRRQSQLLPINDDPIDREDRPEDYRLSVEVYGMNKYYVMDGYVYRREADRHKGLGGLYLCCYQQRQLRCSAKAIAVRIRRTDDERQQLMGRSMGEHNHERPPEGHFWVQQKPSSPLVFLRSNSANIKGSETSGMAKSRKPDYQTSAGGSDEMTVNDDDLFVGREELVVSSAAVNDHRYMPSVGSAPTSEANCGNNHDDASEHSKTALSTKTDYSANRKENESNERKIVHVQAEENGAYFMIDGFAFKRAFVGRPLLVCAESKREFGCTARASLLTVPTRSGAARARQLRAESRHNHSRPSRGQYVLPARSSSTQTVSLQSRSMNPKWLALPTPFIPMPRSVLRIDSKSSSVKETVPFNGRTVLNSVAYCYRYCLDALIRLQEGYYVNRLPQLAKLTDAPGSHLIDYFTHQGEGRLPLIAADEKTKILLSNQIKQYRALCDFNVLAPDALERLLEAYELWTPPSKLRVWWDVGDMLEFLCRLMLRRDRYKEAYLYMLSTSQRSKRLRHLMRPLLPLAEPKFIKCEKDTIRRWELRQSLPSINARIGTAHVDDDQADAVVERYLDAFDSAAALFLKFYNELEEEPDTEDDDNRRAQTRSPDTYENNRRLTSFNYGKHTSAAQRESDKSLSASLSGNAELMLAGGRGDSRLSGGDEDESEDYLPEKDRTTMRGRYKNRFRGRGRPRGRPRGSTRLSAGLDKSAAMAKTLRTGATDAGNEINLDQPSIDLRSDEPSVFLEKSLGKITEMSTSGHNATVDDVERDLDALEAFVTSQERAAEESNPSDKTVTERLGSVGEQTQPNDLPNSQVNATTVVQPTEVMSSMYDSMTLDSVQPMDTTNYAAPANALQALTTEDLLFLQSNQKSAP